LYLCGLNGTFLKSKDIGNNWEPIDLGINSHLYQIQQFQEKVEFLSEENHRLNEVDGKNQELQADIAELTKTGATELPGEKAFRLYDTFGFPLDLVRDIALDSGYTVDEQGFHDAMEAQRETARASWVGADEAIASIYREVLTEAGATEFVGYDSIETDSIVKAMIKDGISVDEANEGDQVEVVLDKTPFYGESGGQAGDTGKLSGEDASLEVHGTKKPVEGLHVHQCLVQRGTLKTWAKLKADVDTVHRNSIRRNHTATHLLHKALREVLGDHVKQAGSLVAADRLRFDFTHFSSMSKEEIHEVEVLVN